MKRILHVVLILILSLVLLACSLLAITAAANPVILSDGFESGNFAAWNTSLGLGNITINTQVVHSGNYSAENSLTGGPANYTWPPGALDALYFQALSSVPNPIYMREYVYINSTTAPSHNGDYYAVGGFSSATGGDYGDGEISVLNVQGILYWGVYYRDNMSTWGFSASISTDNLTADAHAVTIGWHCVELKHLTGTSGEEELFVDGSPIIDHIVNNNDRTVANVVIGGSQGTLNATDRWNYYIDDVVVSSSYIGPITYTLTASTNYGTIFPANSTYNADSPVIVTATPPLTVAGERYLWHGFVGTGTGSYTGLGLPAGDGVSYTAPVTMTGNVSETATWEHQYQLTILSPYGNAIGNGSWFDVGNQAFAAITPLTVSGPTGTQYVFTNWSDNASGTTSPSNAIIVSGPMTAIANWKTQYYLTVSSAHGTVGGSAYYDSGTLANATLNAAIIPGTSGTQYLFTSWGTNATGTNYTMSNPITMSAPKNATANWQTQYNLTVNQLGVSSDFSTTVMTVNGTGYTQTGYSTWANASDTYSFSYSAQLLVAANAKQYILTGVSGNSTSSPTSVTQPTTITASYKTQYYLITTSAYDSPAPANGWFDNGTSITGFVSSPVPAGTGLQYLCVGWNGTGSVTATGLTSVTTFNITAPSTIAWNWQTQYQISFSATPSDGGSVSPSGTNIWENPGTLSISATPGFSYSFSSWSITGNNQVNFAESPTTTVTINGPGTITANFNANPTPSPTPVPTHSPTPPPTASPTPKPTATNTATPSPSPTPSTSQSSNASNIELYGAIAAIVIVVAGIGAFLGLRSRKKPT